MSTFDGGYLIYFPYVREGWEELKSEVLKQNIENGIIAVIWISVFEIGHYSSCLKTYKTIQWPLKTSQQWWRPSIDKYS